MKLEFSLLVVDDAPDNLGIAIQTLEEHLEEKGFNLKCDIPEDLSEDNLRRKAVSEGSNFDLVIIDYKLGVNNMDGAIAASQLRHMLRFTDIVFYSSNPPKELRRRLSEEEVDGVFTSSRIDLDDALKGHADTIIGKAVDLNHMRGIAMAEVAEMDILMGDTLRKIFQIKGNECVANIGNEAIRRLHARTDANLTKIDKLYENGKFSKVVSDGRLFASIDKFNAIKDMVDCLPEKPIEELETFEHYKVEILEKRNKLAHIKEGTDEDSNTILRSTYNNQVEIINENWMTDFRNDLQKHRNVLKTICEEIDNHLSTL